MNRARKSALTTSGILAIALTAALPFVLGAGSAHSAFPEKPVTMIVPFQAGGSVETLVRVYAKALEGELGQPVIVSTRPGGGGAVGATVAAKSDPDGYTMLFAPAAVLLWAPMTQNVEYSHQSFRWLASSTEGQQALIVKSDKPFSTYAELIAHAKSNPGLNFADQDSLSRAFIRFIGKTEGIDWTAIPTKGGGEMVPFLLGGKVDIAWSGGVHQRYGDQMRVLASFNATRLAASPDAPSLKEIYGIAMPSKLVIVVPSATPDDIARTLEAGLNKASRDPNYLDVLTQKLHFPDTFVGSADLAPLVDDMIADLNKVLAAIKD